MSNTLAPRLALPPLLALTLVSCVAIPSSDEPSEAGPKTTSATPDATPIAESDEDDEAEDEEEETETPEELEEDDAPLDDHVGLLGDTIYNGGIQMTVHDAYLADTIPWNESGQREGSSLYEITQLEADGGQWFVVETTIFNDGVQSIDLTCGWPIEVASVDEADREYDTIRQEYKYENNPGCNDNLQPGFDTEMTFVHHVPDDAEIFAFAFRDTAGDDREDFSFFIFDPAIK